MIRAPTAVRCVCRSWRIRRGLRDFPNCPSRPRSSSAWRLLLGDEFDAFLASYEQAAGPGAASEHAQDRPAELRDRLSFSLEPVAWSPETFVLDTRAAEPGESITRPGKHPYHAAGLYYLQEPSATAPVELLDPQPGRDSARPGRGSRWKIDAHRSAAARAGSAGRERGHPQDGPGNWPVTSSAGAPPTWPSRPNRRNVSQSAGPSSSTRSWSTRRAQVRACSARATRPGASGLRRWSRAAPCGRTPSSTRPPAGQARGPAGLLDLHLCAGRRRGDGRPLSGSPPRVLAGRAAGPARL